MSDLISRQAAIEATWEEPMYTDPINVLTEVRDRIKALPSAQSEIIRCKDCKYYTGKWCTKFSTKQFDINDIYKADDDFCSMAERKEE